MHRVSIMGSGVVGLDLGFSLTSLGHGVIFYDINKDKIEQLRQKNYRATMNINEAILNSDISFLTVPTPSTSGRIDLSSIRSVCEDVGRALKIKDSYHTIVVKSTVVPGTTRNVVIPILEGHSGKNIDNDFGVCMNPEFLTEIVHTWTTDEKFRITPKDEPRIVIGETRGSSMSGNLLERIYSPFKRPIFRVSLEEAEAIKYLANCFLAMKISYWNEAFLLLKDFGIDTSKIAPIVGMDERIGKYGTIHGKAFGGKCLPKDLEAFVGWFKESGKEPKILNAVKEINEYIRNNYGVRE